MVSSMSFCADSSLQTKPLCVYSSSLSKTAVHQLSLLFCLSRNRHLYQPLNIPFLGYYITYRIGSQALSLCLKAGKRTLLV